MDRDKLIAAFTLWESDRRAGKCMPDVELAKLPLEEVAERDADALLDYAAKSEVKS